MQKKTFIVTVDGEDLTFEGINLFARLSGAWDGVYVTVEEAAQQNMQRTAGKRCGGCEVPPLTPTVILSIYP